MLKKYKLALATTLAFVAGTAGLAAAHPRIGPEDKQAMHEDKKAERLARFDANRDGKLDKTEKEAAHAAHAAAKFALLDKNRDGKLTLDEFTAGMKHGARHGRRGRFQGRH